MDVKEGAGSATVQDFYWRETLPRAVYFLTHLLVAAASSGHAGHVVRLTRSPLGLDLASPQHMFQDIFVWQQRLAFARRIVFLVSGTPTCR